jgi:oxygen-dependent protoporphyrinogen oxidase
MATDRLGSPHVVVIGGGMAGVCAARYLDDNGARVTVLEARPELGGCVRTVPFAGTYVDVGAEALYTAAPDPMRLVDELGMATDLVGAAGGRTLIDTPNGLRPLPAGVGPAGPTRLAPLLTGRLLGPAGLLRASIEPFLASTHTDDRSVGEVLAHRFGRQVVDRIVDPLLGGLHAGDVDRLAVDAAAPQLAGLLASHRSIVLATRRRRSPAGHGFVTLSGGLGRLFDAASLQLSDRLRTATAARAVVDSHGGRERYRVQTDGETIEADGVVVAIPANVAAKVLAPLGIGPGLDEIRFASVSVVLIAYPATVTDRPALRSTGLLLRSTTDRLLRAATFLSTKWPHLQTPHVLVRASAGRADDQRSNGLGDDELADQLAGDLADIAGLDVRPLAHHVTRWPAAMPQLEVGHTRRIRETRERLAAHPGVALAGASYDGVGLGSAARSGFAAAKQVLEHLDQRIGARA